MFREEVDHRSSRLSRTTESKKHQNAWKNYQNPSSINSNSHPRSRDRSFSSLDRRDDRDTMTNSHDMVTGAIPTPCTVPEFLTGRLCTPELTHGIKIQHKVSLLRISLRSQRPVSTMTTQTPSDALKTCWSE